MSRHTSAASNRELSAVTWSPNWPHRLRVVSNPANAATEITSEIKSKAATEVVAGLKPESRPRTIWQTSQPTHRPADSTPSAPAAREVLAITPARQKTNAPV